VFEESADRDVLVQDVSNATVSVKGAANRSRRFVSTV
jgi:hypothetical protein